MSQRCRSTIPAGQSLDFEASRKAVPDAVFVAVVDPNLVATEIKGGHAHLFFLQVKSLLFAGLHAHAVRLLVGRDPAWEVWSHAPEELINGEDLNAQVVSVPHRRPCLFVRQSSREESTDRNQLAARKEDAWVTTSARSLSVWTHPSPRMYYLFTVSTIPRKDHSSPEHNHNL